MALIDEWSANEKAGALAPPKRGNGKAIAANASMARDYAQQQPSVAQPDAYMVESANARQRFSDSASDLYNYAFGTKDKAGQVSSGEVKPSLVGAGSPDDIVSSEASLIPNNTLSQKYAGSGISDPMATDNTPKIGSLGNTNDTLKMSFDGANNQPATPVGINGSIAPPTQAPYKNAYEDLRNPTNSMEKFVAAGNENILARGVDTQRDFNAQNYDTTPLQPHAPNQAGAMNPEQQMQRMQLQRLTEVATKPIDNSLPYDQRTTLIREQKAAQKALGTLYGADTAGRNRTADSQKADKDYENSKNKATLKGQQDALKAQASKNKEKRYFKTDVLDMMDDVSPEQRFQIENIPTSDGQVYANVLRDLNPQQLSEGLASGALDKFNMKGEDLIRIFSHPSVSGVQ